MAAYHTSHVGAGIQVPDWRSMAFGVAVLGSLAIHGAIIFLVPGEKLQGVAHFGHGGISVSLGPAGRHAGGEVAPAYEDFEAVEEAAIAESEVIEISDTLETVLPETVPPETSPSETIPTQTVSTMLEPDVRAVTEVADANEVEVTELEAPETEPIEVEAVEVVQAEMALLEASSVESPEAVLAARAAPPPVPRRRPQQTKTPSAQEPPKVMTEAKPREAVDRETNTPDVVVALAPRKQARLKVAEGDASKLAKNQVAGQGGRSGESGQNEAGQGDNTAGGGAPGADSDYYREVLAWLEKHKRYPRRSKLRNEQGVVLLRFVVSRDGTVTVSTIKKSSGHKRLDKEAIGMIERAQPLPAIPDDMRQARLDLVVPVKFYLQ